MLYMKQIFHLLAKREYIAYPLLLNRWNIKASIHPLQAHTYSGGKEVFAIKLQADFALPLL